MMKFYEKDEKSTVYIFKDVEHEYDTDLTKS
jgi:hypothetical protein